MFSLCYLVLILFLIWTAWTWCSPGIVDMTYLNYFVLKLCLSCVHLVIILYLRRTDWMWCSRGIVDTRCPPYVPTNHSKAMRIHEKPRCVMPIKQRRHRLMPSYSNKTSSRYYLYSQAHYLSLKQSNLLTNLHKIHTKSEQMSKWLWKLIQ